MRTEVALCSRLRTKTRRRPNRRWPGAVQSTPLMRRSDDAVVVPAPSDCGVVAGFPENVFVEPASIAIGTRSCSRCSVKNQRPLHHDDVGLLPDAEATRMVSQRGLLGLRLLPRKYGVVARAKQVVSCRFEIICPVADLKLLPGGRPLWSSPSFILGQIGLGRSVEDIFSNRSVTMGALSTRRIR